MKCRGNGIFREMLSKGDPLEKRGRKGGEDRSFFTFLILMFKLGIEQESLTCKKFLPTSELKVR